MDDKSGDSDNSDFLINRNPGEAEMGKAKVIVVEIAGLLGYYKHVKTGSRFGL